ncbi:replication endonuclease [Arcobacter butzleri]|uniref:replication endonuclease n=1 Tax=Aliarcobacter butzleri TaxID=28197 RepID=UPI0015872B11|nr:replication endonuclease [Aliarcobacter butzleri]NUW25335.1 replication endonuclease [Aliarcobacter butzleri]
MKNKIIKDISFTNKFIKEINFENEYINIVKNLNNTPNININVNIEKEEIKQELKEEKKEFLSFDRYRNYEIEKYKSISKQKEFKQFQFLKNFVLKNIETNEKMEITHDILKKSKDTYLYFFYVQKILEEKYSNNNDYVSIFLTLTTPSRFHKYSSFNKIYNEKYDNETTINEAYRLLNDTFREIYKNFKINQKFEKIEYSKVIEPHENLTPHLHAILYVKKEYLEKFLKHLNNIIVKNEIGQHKIEILKDTSRGCSYLLKYVQKTTNPQNEDDFHFFNGWKKANKIRVFTSSNSVLNREIYRRINTTLKLSKGLEGKTPLECVLENCEIITNQNNVEMLDDGTYIKSKKQTKEKTKGNKEGRYKVFVQKEKVSKNMYINKECTNILNSKKYDFDKNKILSGSELEFLKYIKVVKNTYKVEINEKEFLNRFETYKQKMDFKGYVQSCIKSLVSELFFDIKIRKSMYSLKNLTIFDKTTNTKLYEKQDFEIEKIINDSSIVKYNYEYEKELDYKFHEKINYSDHTIRKMNYYVEKMKNENEINIELEKSEFDVEFNSNFNFYEI